MNTVKKNGGFTLVELIIVIAILAILSSVAVAGYSSYIKNANNSATESFLNEVKTHVVLANAKAGDVGTIEVTNGANGKLTVKVTKSTPGFADDFADNIKDVYGDGSAPALSQDGTYYTFTVDAPTAWANSKYGSAATPKATFNWDTNKWA